MRCQRQVPLSADSSGPRNAQLIRQIELPDHPAMHGKSAIGNSLNIIFRVTPKAPQTSRKITSLKTT